MLKHKSQTQTTRAGRANPAEREKTMQRCRAYKVAYRMTQYGEEKEAEVIAKNKAEAYEWATYEIIPSIEGTLPYSSWVVAVQMENNKVHTFNTCEGLAY